MTRVAVLTRISENGPMQGDRNRLGGLLAALRSLGWDVDVIHLGKDARIERTPFVACSPYLWRPHYRAPDLQVDGVIAFQLSCAPSALSVDAGWRMLDLTDSLDWYRKHLGWNARTMLKQATLAGIGREELRLAKQFDQVLVSAVPDAEWLLQHGLKTTVIPNGVRLKMMLEPGDSRHLVMVANFSYLPNRLGIESFLRVIWPYLESHHYRLTLVGAGSEILDVPNGVVAMGFQEEILSIYQACGVAISPVRVGAGSQNKILEAMAMCRPVLAHQEGIPGLSPEERAAVIAVDEDPGSWLAALNALQDERYYRSKARAGYDAVKLFRDQFVDGLRDVPLSIGK